MSQNKRKPDYQIKIIQKRKILFQNLNIYPVELHRDLSLDQLYSSFNDVQTHPNNDSLATFASTQEL